MKRLSSFLTIWWYERLGPLLLGAALLITAVALAVFVMRGTVAPAWLLAPVVLALAVFAYLRRIIFPLADEVLDDGNALLVRNGRHTTRLALRDITGIEYSLIFDPPRLFIRATTPSGKMEVVFMPHLFTGMCFLRRHPLVDALRRRSNHNCPEKVLDL